MDSTKDLKDRLKEFTDLPKDVIEFLKVFLWISVDSLKEFEDFPKDLQGFP